jgi:hypothetical protein
LIWWTVDPGQNLGWAKFSEKKLLKWGVIYGKGKDWREKALFVARAAPWNLYKSRVFLEWPSYQTLAAQQTGSIIKLAYLCGLLYWCWKPVKLIPVIKWKGSLPKIVTQRRAEVFFQQKGFKSHAADAVGIGMYVIQEGLWSLSEGKKNFGH